MSPPYATLALALFALSPRTWELAYSVKQYTGERALAALLIIAAWHCLEEAAAPRFVTLTHLRPVGGRAIYPIAFAGIAGLLLLSMHAGYIRPNADRTVQDFFFQRETVADSIKAFPYVIVRTTAINRVLPNLLLGSYPQLAIQVGLILAALVAVLRQGGRPAAAFNRLLLLCGAPVLVTIALHLAKLYPISVRTTAFLAGPFFSTP